MYDFDHDLFLALNFDGGEVGDFLMNTVSGTAMWIPLYLLILWMIWRHDGWKGMLLFLVLMIGAIALSDMISGIFKHNGLLGDLLPDFQPRWRPMFTPALEDLSITPDSLFNLHVLRRDDPAAFANLGLVHEWAVHVPVEAVSGKFGTVSAHASTILALAVISCCALKRKWFTWLMVFSTVIICYSRIYLGKHFPMDLVWGSLVGAAAGYLGWVVYRLIIRRTTSDKRQNEE